MCVWDLALLAGRTDKVGRRQPYGHAPDCADVELETLTATQPGYTDDLHLGKLLIPVADAVDGLRAQVLAAPDFPDSEFCSSRKRPNVSIAARPHNMEGVDG